MKLNATFRLSAMMLGLALIGVQGCATNDASISPAAPSAALSQAASKPANQLKISNATVKWKENPAFAISLHRTMPAVLTNLAIAYYDIQRPYEVVPADIPLQPTSFVASSESKRLADNYYAEMLNRFRESSETKLTLAFSERGVKGGTDFDVIVTPVTGYQSVDGWGSNAVLRTDISEASTGRTWSLETTVKSGMHLTGVHNASKPTVKFVDQYVEGVLAALRSAKAIH